MLFVELARASTRAAASAKRSEKIAVFADVFARLAPDEVEPAVAFAVGTTPHGRVGVGWATMRDVRPAPAGTPSLTIGDVAAAIDELAGIAGSGSVARRREVVYAVLSRSTEDEQRLLVAVIGGELRQGALEGVVAAAVAKAASVKVGDVQRGAMFAGSLPSAARAVLTGGAEALASIALTPAVPVQPMLASPSTDIVEAMSAATAESGSASVEWKLDGARIQAHRAGGEVRLFTRNLNEVTDRLVGVVEVVRALPGADLVLDGEVLGVSDDGSPRRFQDTMGDFSADAPGEAGARGRGLRAYFFDVLHAGQPLVDEPLSVRREALEALVPAASRLPSIVTADADEADRFLSQAVAAGHEGVMVKDPASRYEAGRRGGSWRKVKPVHTLDLVVIGVEWGHGRRRGWLSNLHLGARSGDGGFVMVGKTFKGLTDELLRWQTDRFRRLQIGEGPDEDGRHVVFVQPEQVVEIALDGVQVSSRYPGGVALRFARVRRYRHDKPPTQADTIDDVRALLR